MKRQLRTTIALAAFAIMGALTAAAAQPGTLISIRIETGDTYTNLFGPDWEKAYSHNKVTVIRKGRAISSPDILIEGSVLTVTPDVRLTPRALTRLAGLSQRRTELQARLTALGSKLNSVPEARDAAEQCRKLLDSDRAFAAADVEFAAREVEHLERLAQNVVAQRPNPQTFFPRWVVLLSCGITALAGAILWRRQRPLYPEGSARYREALADVRTAFNAMQGNL